MDLPQTVSIGLLALIIASLPKVQRRLTVTGIFLFSALAILLSAELFALKGRPGVGLRALVSSKVNQWTLLVGMLPSGASVRHNIRTLADYVIGITK